MDEPTQIQHLESDVEKTVTRFRKEYEITYASVIGVLHLQIAKLEQEALETEENGEY